jgi:membrane-associated phospholipid phosphatase
MAAITSVAISAVCPAVGPWVVYGFKPSPIIQAHTQEVLRALKASIGTVHDLGDYSALVSFPSFHTALAILCVIALWRWRLVRIPALLFGLLVCISTVTTGWHYEIDVIGGALVALIAYAVGSWALRSSFKIQPWNASPSVDLVDDAASVRSHLATLLSDNNRG